MSKLGSSLKQNLTFIEQLLYAKYSSEPFTCNHLFSLNNTLSQHYHPNPLYSRARRSTEAKLTCTKQCIYKQQAEIWTQAFSCLY